MAQVRRRRSPRSTAAVAKQSAKEYLTMGLIMALVVIAIIFFIRLRTNGAVGVSPFASTDTFLKGISVNGVDLQGMTYEQGETAVADQINRRLNSPINLHYNGHTYTVTPAELDAKMLEVENNLTQAWHFGHVGSAEQRKEQYEYVMAGGESSFNCELTYDEALLDKFIDSVKVNVDKHPKDAQIQWSKTENYKITPEEWGVQLQPELLREQIVSVIEQGTSADINLVPANWRPKYTAEDLKGSTQLIAERKTNAASSDENRNKNIVRAMRRFNKGIRIDVGQTMSFNEIVGWRTLEEGFFEAKEIVDGELTEGVGGGTCQASSTLFPALIEAGLTIEERHQHSLRVGYCAPSQDATVTNRGKDLRFTNRTDYPIFIFGYANYTECVVRIYGHPTELKIKYVTRAVVKAIEPDGFTPVPDTKRKYVTSPGDMKEKKKGTPGCVTEGWIEYYNRASGELVDQVRQWKDEYAPVKPEVWVYAN